MVTERPPSTGAAVSAAVSLLVFGLLAGSVTYVLVVFTGWTNEECAPGAFACDAAAVLRVRVLLAAGFVLELALAVAALVRAVRGRPSVVWTALAWPAWLACVAVGQIAAG
ncbi:hypothetical protein ACQPX6_21845 [Actinomycetospora sp. CA-101289]|uniref:hypothetical protein n=1 Tax=Actinomycetospora sp. CA-101289 TaxID=3239893 RepID=UPI003D95747B